MIFIYCNLPWSPNRGKKTPKDKSPIQNPKNHTNSSKSRDPTPKSKGEGMRAEFYHGFTKKAKESRFETHIDWKKERDPMIDEEKGAWDLVFDIDLVFFFALGGGGREVWERSYECGNDVGFVAKERKFNDQNTPNTKVTQRSNGKGVFGNSMEFFLFFEGSYN